MKKHLQYQCHLISGAGIWPLSESLNSLQDIPLPQNPKEVKHFLDLAGYYRKLVLRFTD